jgi:hypothetical protein
MPYLDDASELTWTEEGPRLSQFCHLNSDAAGEPLVYCA